MLTLDKTRIPELRGSLEDGDSGEDAIRDDKREEQVAANGGETPWSTGTKLEAGDNSIPRRIVLTREQSCSRPARSFIYIFFSTIKILEAKKPADEHGLFSSFMLLPETLSHQQQRNS